MTLKAKLKSSFAWMSNPQYLAQVGHFFGACAVVLIASIFSLALHKGWTPTIVVLAVGVSLATFKEFVFDVSSWGEGDSWPDSLMDWAFYMLGAGVATLIFWAALTLSVSHLRS